MTVVESVEPVYDARVTGRIHRSVWREPSLDLVLTLFGVMLGRAFGLHVSMLLVLAVPAVWLAALHSQSAYRPTALGATSLELTRTVARAGAVAGAAAFALEAAVGLPGATSVWLLAFAVAGVGAVGHRLLTDSVLRSNARPARVLAIGATEHLGAALDELLRGNGRRLEIASVRSTDDGHIDPLDVARAVARHGADAVVVVPPVDARELRRLGWLLADAGTELYVTTPLHDVDPARTRMTGSGGLGMLEVRLPENRVSRMVKDALERLAATALLILISPVLLGLMLVIRLDSPGSALFTQLRVGKDGQLFTMYKLRTMCTDAELTKARLTAENESDGVLFKIRRDPRITTMGAFLRRYSLDELPQLVNVIRGNMSLVGPRPALPQEVARYDLDPPRRLAVKPGLTGLWQVSGRSDLSWEESVRLDLAYVDNWSLGLDATILCRTVGAVISQRGAY